MLEVLNKNYRKVDIIRKFDFAQHVVQFRGLGEFKINIREFEKYLYLVSDEQYYVLFDGKIFGKIEAVSKKQDENSDNVTILEIRGRLANVILQQAVNYGTITVKGKTHQLIAEMIRQRILTRNLDAVIPKFTLVYDAAMLSKKCSDVSKQMTGETVYDNIYPSLEQDNLGIVINAVQVNESKLLEDQSSNIESFEISIECGSDRTRGNTDGNNPVIFSQSLSNIFRTEYNRSDENYSNVAYVAGEGEDQDRKWYKIQRDGSAINDNLYGLSEMWVDARDIQSESESEDGEQTTLTPQEYEKLINDRAKEKFAENDVVREYTATVNTNNAQYKYGVDYFLGDWVTVLDTELNIEKEAQVTSVTKSWNGENSDAVFDVELTYGQLRKDLTQQIMASAKQVEKNAANIKYLESMISNISPSIKEMYLALHPIGDIVMNTSGINPGTIYGGTWAAWGSGRVPVGVNTSDGDFNTVEKQAGNKTNSYTPSGSVANTTLTETQIPSHAHGLNGHTHGVSITSGGMSANSTGIINNVAVRSSSVGTTVSGAFALLSPTTNVGYAVNEKGGSASYSDRLQMTISHTHLVSGNTGGNSGNTTNTGGSGAHNHGFTGTGANISTIQPYITCYMFKRTA